ncbi:MAG: hypothetical protein AAF367_10240 [Pseudomonadota bacterium]
MSTGFSDFANAMAGARRMNAAPEAPALSRIAILGGGDDARLIAALCLAEGAEVTLFSAYGAELAAMASGVALRGDGPVGSYQVNREDAPSIRTTAELDAAVSDAEVIFLTGPIHKQRTYAMVLANHLCDGQVLVLAPGRSMGALEAAWLLRVGGATADVTLVEAQGLPFWTRAEGSTLHLSTAVPVAAATLPSGRAHVLEGLKRYLPNLDPVAGVLASGFADGSGLVEAPALLLGGAGMMAGGPKLPMGGTPLEENESFRNLIGPEQADIIRQLASERHNVACRFGVRDLPGADAWMNIHAGAASGAGRRPVPSRDEAKKLLRDAAIGSLEPLLSAARVAGCEAKLTEATLRMISATLGADLSPAGRRLETVGIRADDIDDARRLMDKIAKGAA